MIWQPPESSRLCITGKQGFGKSVKSSRYVKKIFRSTLWQPMRDWNIGEEISVYEYLEEAPKYDGRMMGFTVRPTDYDEDTMKDEHEILCAEVYRIGAMCFIIEEVSQVCDNTKGEKPRREYSRLLIEGRHRAVSMVTIGQRFAQFPVSVRSSATRVLAFHQDEPRDVAAWEERIWPMECPKPINQLAKREYIDWRAGDDGLNTIELCYSK